MNRSTRNIFQIVFLVLFVLILIRLFPLVIRLMEGAALSIGRFWWIILIVALLIWLISVFRKRNSG